MIDHSQHGEYSKVIEPFFRDHPAKHKFLVDVGACGMQMSNTYNLIAQHGWSGIWYEALSQAVQNCLRCTKGFDVEVVHAAVGAPEKQVTEDGRVKVYKKCGWFTTDPEWDYSNDPVTPVGWAPRMVLSEDLKRRNVPLDFDFLDIDVEGVDMEVLDDILSSQFRPKMIIVETHSLPDRYKEALSTEYDLHSEVSPNEFWVRS